MKGVLLSGAPSAALVDLTHQVSPGDIRAAAYLLGRTWQRFPEGTVHLVVVDPGVGSTRHPLALHAHGHSFVGPDNGVFTHILQDAEVDVVVLRTPAEASPTFHGSDVFAPAAAALASGTDLSTLGSPLGGIPSRLAYPRPRIEGRCLVGEVVYVDHFGTLITNLTGEVVPPHAHVVVQDLDLGELRRTYSDVAPGGLVAYLGSDGSVEIAVRNGSAAERLAMGVGGRVRAYPE
jgi:S-adenosyl-L-methionine hydrolase (adenosine-forming)